MHHSSFFKGTGFLYWCCLLAFLDQAGLRAEETLRYAARTWQVREGLPYNAVFAVRQTSDGYLWVGTGEGLVRFDSLRFKRFQDDAAGLRRQIIRTLFQSRDGKLWIGVEGSTLICWDGARFSNPIPLPPGTFVRTIIEGQDGTLWLGTSNGLALWRGGKLEWITEADGLIHPSVFALCEDRNGDIWVGTFDGLQRIHEGRIEETFLWSVHSKEISPAAKISESHRVHRNLLGRAVKTLLCDKQGRIWIGLDGGSLACWSDGKMKRFLREAGLPDQFVLSSFQDSQGRIWIGTRSGLCQVEGDKLIPVVSIMGESFETIYCITEDAEGGIWIGSKDGLSRLKPLPFAAITKTQGLTHNNVMSVREDRDGKMWISTWGGGVNIFDGTGIRYFNHTNSSVFDLVLGMCERRDGSMWLGGDYDLGIAALGPAGVKNYGKAEGLTHSAVRTLFEDHAGNFWFGTSGALYLWKTGAVQKFTMENGLAGNIVRAVAEDGDGNLWIGTDGGVSERTASGFVNFTTANGLGTNSVSDVFIDAQNAVWIGTMGGGVSRVENGKVRTYTSRQGLLADTILAIVEDDQERLWFSSFNGVFRIDKKRFRQLDEGAGNFLESVSYGTEDGLSTLYCNGVAKPSAWKSHDGRLWFATTRGVAVIDSHEIKDTPKIPPQIVIEKIVADRKVQSLKFKVQRLAVAPTLNFEPETLNIAPGRGELEFHYAALSFAAPEKNRFRYKLEGFDDDWVDAGNRAEAYYNNLAPGTYTFHVMGCNNEGTWNNADAALTIRLLPHFWQTWWFKSSLVLIAGAAIFGAYRIRVARLQEIERLRLRIAADLHDEVGSSLGSISMLSEMLHRYGSDADETRKGLLKIHRTSMQTANSIRDIVWFINPDYDTAHDLIQRMKDVAEGLLGAMEKEIRIDLENPSAQLSLEFRQNFFLIYKETLANVAKHSKATKVLISISEKSGAWEMNIQDNGIGFDPDSPKKGNGLKNLRRRAASLRGSIEIQSSQNKGTSIMLRARN